MRIEPLAVRVGCTNAGAPWLSAFVRKVYCANFVHDRDFADELVVEQCFRFAIEGPDKFIETALTDEAKALPRDQTEAALQTDIFCALSFRVGSEFSWGRDRLIDARA
jgi:2-hydroxychromene-2-carboxylate isomerase